MVTEQLTDYVRQSRESGVVDEQIRLNLSTQDGG
jgi:hypothetical protein